MVLISKARPRRHRQAGGTVLGVIVGLIVGLAIAVVVAVMITKSTLPFTNKQAQPERAAGVAGGQIADPNKPLYGNKEPAREAAKAFAPAAPATPGADGAEPTAVAEPKAAALDQARDKAARDKVASDKTASDKTAAAIDKAIADAKAAARSTPKSGERASPDDRSEAAQPDPNAEKWIYFLQAGAFREAGDAENAKAKLALMGFEANITERPSDTGSLFRVRVGPFNQLEVMTRARSKLSDNGVDVAVVRTAR
jgi:cell division protein FtsN